MIVEKTGILAFGFMLVIRKQRGIRIIIKVGFYRIIIGEYT